VGDEFGTAAQRQQLVDQGAADQADDVTVVALRYLGR